MKRTKPPGVKPRADRTTIRDRRIPVLLTAIEYAALEAYAEAHNTSMAHVLRDAARAVGHLPPEGSAPNGTPD